MDRRALLEDLRELPRERTMLLPALHLAHDRLGYLPGWAIEAIGAWLHVPKSEVYGAATSYANFRFRPPPRHRIKVCCGAACRVKGSGHLVEKLEEDLGVRLGGTTPSGAISLEKSDCLFACAVGPVVEIDGVTHGRSDEAKLTELIRDLGGGDR